MRLNRERFFLRLLISALFALAGAVAAFSQTALDPNIQKAVAGVSQDRIKENDLALVNFGTRHSLSVNTPASTGKGIVAAREWIRGQFDQYAKSCNGCLEVKTYAFTQPTSARIPQPTELVDVYAVQKGTSPESSKNIIVIGGHYDTIAIAKMLDAEVPGPGANDDGSGTSLVLESARVLSQFKFPATIVYVTFAAEEQGLFGSKGFAKMAKEQGWNIVAVLSNDIVGGDNTQDQQNTVRIFSESLPANADEATIKRLRMLGAESDSPSRQLARFIQSTVPAYLGPDGLKPKLIFRQDRFLRGGDHTSFNEEGFTAVRITEFRENFDHQHQLVRTENGIEYGDLPKFVDYHYLAGVTKLNVASAALLASAPAAPANVQLLTRELVNDSTLEWSPSPDGRAAGYEVLIRDTTSPVWEQTIPAGSETRITVPQSKDNVIFAVRAYDAQGHRSLAIYPTPKR